MSEVKKDKKLPSCKKFMSRNVTEFKHLLKNCQTTENDLNWVINLRDNKIKEIEKISDCPPDVYFKQTKSAEFKVRKKYEGRQPKLQPNEYDTCFLKGNQHHTENQLQFYNSLRKDDFAKESALPLKNFSTIPFKDRHNSCKFIKKECIKKIKDISQEDFEQGLDGAHKQEQYTEKIVKVKNYACLSPFTKLRGRNQVSLPSLAWQMGLRSYR